MTFLEVRCFPGNIPNDGVRIRGFRLIGPSFGQQTSNETGIRVQECVDVEVSNMEIAGWGGAAIAVKDNDPVLDIPEGCERVPPRPRSGRPHPRPLSQAFRCPPGKQVTRLPYPGPYGRMTQASQVRIFNNYLHHNQHPSDGTSAAGYGVDVGYGAFAQITENVFDDNRHAIVASGDSGGYDAKRNLILKGGGYHCCGFRHTHIVDVHGDDHCGFLGLVSSHVYNCGNAGYQFSFEENAFQYLRDNAIKIRGKPRHHAYIANNVFPHEGLEDDWGDDAVYLQTTSNVEIGRGNLHPRDSFGKYEVCDFDGDGIDDLFLATGKTWWYSSMGEFQWSYLGRKPQSGDEIQLGYFDADQRCDVMTESGGRWLISSRGYGDWQSFGEFETALAQVRFGRFDLADVDTRAGATKQTTHALRRLDGGQWQITPLTSRDWQDAQSSPLPLSKLQFGDFTGDGVTDVIAVVERRWQISEGARRPWRILNETLGDSVESLYFADLNNDNIDEILKFQPMTESREDPCPEEEVANCFTSIDRGWRVSWNGTSAWEPLLPVVDAQLWEAKKFFFAPSAKFVGRFGLARGGGTLLVDPNRVGRFYSPGERATGAPTEWRSVFPY